MIVIARTRLHSKTFRPLNIAFISRIFWKGIFRSVIFWTIICYLNFLCRPRGIDSFMVNWSISFKSIKSCSFHLLIIVFCLVLPRSWSPIISSIFILSSYCIWFWKVCFIWVIISWPSMCCQRFSIIKCFYSHLILWPFLNSRRNIIVSWRREILFVLFKTCVFPYTIVFSTLCPWDIIGSWVWIIYTFGPYLLTHYFMKTYLFAL